jgi:hypothetical protein
MGKEAEKMRLKGDNLHRVINNMALLGISWVILRDFLFEDEEGDKAKIDFEFNESLMNIFKQNFERVQNFNPKVLFINKFWELVEEEELVIEKENLESTSANKTKVIGVYQKNEDNSIKIGLSINKAINKVEAVIGGKGSLGLSKKELKRMLLESRIIYENNSGTVSIGKGSRGVYWIGDIPDQIKRRFFN